jgi:hypothetical protein|tara:strand:+ start:397 stop:681 length:285 start_codon:yes stop_codon:yes gene_type:complete
MTAFTEAWKLLKMGQEGMNVEEQGNGEEGVAMHHDLPSYMEEAMNQTTDKRKKREKANKLRQRVSDHDEDSKVIQYYKDNHPQWFNEWKDGAGE